MAARGAGDKEGLGQPEPVELAEGAELDAEVPEAPSVGSSALLISVCVIASRITGFLRTWAMAFALGSTMLASSYQVANNLPNMLYELAVGGMLVTAFLPVYVSVKRHRGEGGSNDYASNILTITTLFLAVVSLLGIIFAPELIYTQSFMSDQETMGTAVFFFRFFAIQIVFYGASAIISGLLNGNRDFLWASLAPAFNNLVVITTFAAYAFVAPGNEGVALWIIALGNPLGVFIQMAIQLPALRRNGIRLRMHIDFKDPALRETLSIGIPALIVMLTSFVIVSVQNAVAYDIAGNGPSIIAYARLWFTLPYAFLAVPITTAMFTELSEMQANNERDRFSHGVIGGTRQILFLTTPFALYLIVFSVPLVSLYHAGAFTTDAIYEVALYVAILAISLPFYSVCTYLQKVFSALRKMRQFSLINAGCALLQIAFTLIGGSWLLRDTGFALECIALGETVFFLANDLICFLYLHRCFGSFGWGQVVASFVRSLGLGLLGAAVGFGIVIVVNQIGGGFDASILLAILAIVLGGLPAVLLTFGIAMKLKLPGAQFITDAAAGFWGKLKARFVHR